LKKLKTEAARGVDLRCPPQSGRGAAREEISRRKRRNLTQRTGLLGRGEGKRLEEREASSGPKVKLSKRRSENLESDSGRKTGVLQVPLRRTKRR